MSLGGRGIDTAMWCQNQAGVATPKAQPSGYDVHSVVHLQTPVAMLAMGMSTPGAMVFVGTVTALETLRKKGASDSAIDRSDIATINGS